MEKSNSMGKRIFQLILGILLISIGVGAFRLSSFGVDPFTCMNLGISQYLGMSFGNWQLIINIFILIIVYFTVRHHIGFGTIVNMVGVGYVADFICWLVNDQLDLSMTMAVRIITFAIGLFVISFGVALYMEANLGISPYDCIAFIVNKFTKLSFRISRILSDIVLILIGIGFGIAAKADLWELVGIGTALNALINGPAIQFFRTKVFKNEL